LITHLIVMAIDVNNLVTTALSIVSIATLAGLGLLRGTVTNLRENLKDARDEITDKERRLTEAEKTIATQKSDLAALGRVVTGEDKIDALGHRMERKFGELMASVKDLLDLVRSKP
jgi:uncharacterized coiled-coil protein SlyX